MKKKIIYLSIFVLILGSFLVVLLSNNKNNINDSVVYIESLNDESITSGSGFVYKIENNKNFIITSYHVINNYDEIYVYNSKKEKIEAKVFKYDEYTDIAILLIEDKLNLKEINIGNSEKIKEEDKVYAVGTPIEIENINKISKGNILSKNKEIKINGINYNSIEINIGVDYGNSGGPLLNKDNEVIGMMFVMEEDKKIGYALPINFVMDIVGKLEKDEIKRPNLGAVMCNTTNTEMLNEYSINIDSVTGVVLLELEEDGLLNKAGLQKGDVITMFNEINIKNVTDLRESLYKKEIGDIVEIEYYRKGMNYKVSVEL